MHRKGTGNLYEKVIAPENIEKAIYMASSQKRDHRIVKKIIANKEKIIPYIHDNFHVSGNYRIKERKDISSGKVRKLTVPPYYPDQIIHHAVIQICGPYIKRRYMPESTCSIKGMGCKEASRLTRKAIASGEKYFVKFDIHHYFQSVDHEVLYQQLTKIFKDKKLLAILKEIIDSNPEGIPIGNYTSQYFANLYLTPLDRFIKETMKVSHYVRYMDDFIIFGRNKRKMIRQIEQILDFIHKELHLETHNDEKVDTIGYTDRDGVKHGCPIDFVAFRHYHGYVTLRPKLWVRMRRTILRMIARPCKKLAKRLASYLGYLKRSDSRYIMKRYYPVIRNALFLLRKRKGEKKNELQNRNLQPMPC